MKSLVFICLAVFSGMIVQAQTSDSAISRQTAASYVQTVEASCGECKFGMTGTGCHLAVRINGKGYFVDGTAIDKHGDAHDEDGFCNAIRKAEVKGSIVNDRFVATGFKLLPIEKSK